MSTVEHADEPSATSVTETATNVSESESFTYEKDGLDLTSYALDFITNENEYNTLISSYTTENLVALFICVEGLVTCAGYYHKNGELEEYIRNNEPSDKKFNSISEWYNDYYGEPTTINKMLNNVFIGEDLVPLWKVLVDASNQDKEEEEINKEDNVISNSKHISLISYVSITLTLCSFVLGIGFLTFLHLILDA
jgi:hypothetical protein